VSQFEALGLIETRGLTAAIEAADAAVKTANVRLVGIRKTVPALMTVQIAGETAAVRSGVDAARAAAERVGEVVSSHVIPRPDHAVARLQEMTPSPPATGSRARKSPKRASPKRPTERSSGSESPASASKSLESMTVRELRALARTTPGLALKGRGIAGATKSELLRAFGR
jgi:microcompartment protein CcmL/EutN